MQVVLDVSGSRLSVADKLLLQRSAQSIADKFGKHFSQAKFAFHIKRSASKRLVQVKGILETNKGRFYSSKEGWRVGKVCTHALESIHAQLTRKPWNF